MRLDLYLAENKIYGSRTRAVRAIEDGCVKVNGNVVLKPSFNVSGSDAVEAGKDPVPYVSRGAFKLKHALEKFEIDIKGMTVLDIGASTGGFTQIMLSAGAEKVYAVDVGHNQLDSSLTENIAVVNMEGTDIRTLPTLGYESFFDFAACDASFISLTKILPAAAAVLSASAKAVFLIKPQFEVGKRFVGKGGVVKDKRAVSDAVKYVSEFAQACGFSIEAPVIPSPIRGGDGNEEYLLFLKK